MWTKCLIQTLAHHEPHFLVLVPWTNGEPKFGFFRLASPRPAPGSVGPRLGKLLLGSLAEQLGTCQPSNDANGCPGRHMK